MILLCLYSFFFAEGGGGVKVGSLGRLNLCHRPIERPNEATASYFIVNGQNKVIVSQTMTLFFLICFF